MSFSVDQRIKSTCFFLADWPLSSVYLKDNANYPWFILIPRVTDVCEMDELPPSSQQLLMQEITTLSSLIKNHYQPTKLNVATLGNIVQQLHIHVVARFTSDALWPHGIWQASQSSVPYTASCRDTLLELFRARLKESVFT